MASGSSGRANVGAKGFDFASDDILCSYEDYGNQDSANGSISDPVIVASTGKDFHSRSGRSPVYAAAKYSQPEDSFNQDVIAAVERNMKRNADNLLRFLEGISSRLSQLELYCYNLDKSIGEMRSDLIRDHRESDSKLKAIEKHLQEVHRSVQILRDKQELAETQKELANLQVVHKDSTLSSHSQSTEGRASPSISESKTTDNTPDTRNHQLALALPHQVAPTQQPAPPPPPTPPQNVTQQPSYYLPAPRHLPNPPASAQHPQHQYVAPDSQYQTPHMQDPRSAQPPTVSQVNPTPPIQQFPQYQQLPMHTQIRSQSPVYPPPYAPSQPANQPPENLPNTMPMQVVPYPGIPQPEPTRADAMPFGYPGPGRATPQQPPPPQQIKAGYGLQPSDAYRASGPHPALPPGSTFMLYNGEGGPAHYQPQTPHFTQGGYPPSSTNPPPNSAPPPNLVIRNPQFMQNHPYSELIEKLASMGFRGDHVANVIQRMEETGHPVDFNAVLDRMNAHSSVAAPQRGGWSG